jgi:cytoskeletal protein CcmA (bactofilin family)
MTARVCAEHTKPRSSRATYDVLLRSAAEEVEIARKIDESHEESDYLSDRNAVSAGKLHFEGTVELGGTVTGQMLGILFGPESDVNGRLRFGGPVQIDGTFRGSITTDDALLVGEHAKIDADINCGAATIHGAVTGNITAKDAVSLEPTSRVKGDVTAPALSVAKGATFDGLSRMGTTPAAKKRPNR